MSAQSWSRRHHWFEPTSSLPIFKGFYLVIYKTLALIFPVQLNECKSYIYAKIQAEICMFTQQNRRGLNQPILRPLWLMTSAWADVTSVPGVVYWKVTFSTCLHFTHLLLGKIAPNWCCIMHESRNMVSQLPLAMPIYYVRHIHLMHLARESMRFV